MFDIITAYGMGERHAVICDCKEWISDYFIDIEPSVMAWADHRLTECKNNPRVRPMGQ